jgi:vancomycin permeability regulator SanA
MGVRKYISLLFKLLRRYYIFVVLAIVLGAVMCVAPMAYTFKTTRGNRYDLDKASISQVPYHEVAIVFGAGVQKNGEPTPYLRHRIETAVKLYKAKRVSKLLMSADNSSKKYNEPSAMKRYAEKLGVPANAITLDYAGFNTYDSCYRAHAVFGLKEATLVSQGYHLPRAMTTCEGLGVKNTGVIAEDQSRDYTVNYILREFLSTDKMVIQQIFKPHPTVLGTPEQI